MESLHQPEGVTTWTEIKDRWSRGATASVLFALGLYIPGLVIYYGVLAAADAMGLLPDTQKVAAWSAVAIACPLIIGGGMLDTIAEGSSHYRRLVERTLRDTWGGSGH